MNVIAFTRRCALLRASKDDRPRMRPILRGSPKSGSHLRMTPAHAGPRSMLRRRVQQASLVETCLRLLATRCAQVVQILRLENQRAQGKPGARCTRGRAWCVESTRVSHHRFTGTHGLPCAMVLTAYFALSPVTGLCCHRRPQETSKKLASRELDASVGASGPHDFAVRASVIRLLTCRVHRIPHPTSVTIAKRPSGGTGWRWM